MSKFLNIVSTAVAVLATIIAGVWLVRSLFTPPDVHTRIHELGNWVTGIAFNLVLILLATSLIQYLDRKK